MQGFDGDDIEEEYEEDILLSQMYPGVDLAQADEEVEDEADFRANPAEERAQVRPFFSFPLFFLFFFSSSSSCVIGRRP